MRKELSQQRRKKLLSRDKSMKWSRQTRKTKKSMKKLPKFNQKLRSPIGKCSRTAKEMNALWWELTTIERTNLMTWTSQTPRTTLRTSMSNNNSTRANNKSHWVRTELAVYWKTLIIKPQALTLQGIRLSNNSLKILVESITSQWKTFLLEFYCLTNAMQSMISTLLFITQVSL